MIPAENLVAAAAGAGTKIAITVTSPEQVRSVIKTAALLVCFVTAFSFRNRCTAILCKKR
jgi:hypothetical protein